MLLLDRTGMLARHFPFFPEQFWSGFVCKNRPMSEETHHSFHLRSLNNKNFKWLQYNMGPHVWRKPFEECSTYCLPSFCMASTTGAQPCSAVKPMRRCTRQGPLFFWPPTLFFWPPLVFLTPHLVFLTPCFFNPLTLFFWPPTLFFFETLTLFFWPPTLFFWPPHLVFFDPPPCFFDPPPCFFDPLDLLSGPPWNSLDSLGLIFCFRGRFWIFFGSWFYAFLLLCFSAVLPFCFSASLLLCVSACPPFAFAASLLVYLSAFLLFALPAFCFSCFSAFHASLLYRLLFFSASLFCASMPFYFYYYYSTFSFPQSCVLPLYFLLLCSSASLLPVFTAYLFSFFHFALFCPVCILH